MTSTRPQLSDSQFKELRAIIYERSGIHFEENKKYILDSRLSQRLTDLELDDFSQYLALLSTGPYQMDEFQEMFNRITINETSFFRNEPQLDVFEKRVLPVLLEKRSATKRLRIWSAACSTGDEPYTIAIQLHRTLGSRLRDWTIEILGTDISERALKIAQSGRYTEYAFRTTSPLVRNRYFTQNGSSWDLLPEIRSMVDFDVLNLKDRMGARRLGTFDLIFCRNVLIYFDQPMKDQVLDTFAHQLADDGYLFLGHSETSSQTRSEFRALASPQAFAFGGVRAADPTAPQSRAA